MIADSHGANAAGVYGGRISPCMGIDRRASFDDRIDVCNRDEDLYRTARHRHSDRELIEIARIIVIDQHPGQARKVAQRKIRLGGFADSVCLYENRGREIRQKASVQHRPSRDAPQLVSARRGRPVCGELLILALRINSAQELLGHGGDGRIHAPYNRLWRRTG